MKLELYVEVVTVGLNGRARWTVIYDILLEAILEGQTCQEVFNVKFFELVLVAVLSIHILQREVLLLGRKLSPQRTPAWRELSHGKGFKLHKGKNKPFGHFFSLVAHERSKKWKD
eukprot:4539234-Amphidinium_carterae.1